MRERYRGSRDPREAARQVRDLLALRYYDRIVIGDEMLLRALYADGRFGPWLPVDADRTAAVDLVTSKHAFVKRAPQLGINIPESTIAGTPAQIRAAARRIGFPVVLRGDAGFGGSDVRVCADGSALERACAELLTRNAHLVVQRFVDGEPTSACVLYDRGRVVALKSYRAQCAFPDARSASTVHEFFSHPAIGAAARALGAATGFHGMLGMDFVYDGDALHALEINPRPTIGFSGTVANRAFFAPFVARFVNGEAGAQAVEYDGRVRLATYFPGYLFYLTTAAARRDPLALRRVPACLGQAGTKDVLLALWEITRFVSDRIRKRFPHTGPAMGRAIESAPVTTPLAAPVAEPVGVAP